MIMILKGVMLICSVSLLVLEVISHDYSENYYVVLAIVMILIEPIINFINKLIWLLKPMKESE